MGAWSAEPFGNDTACDWADELEEADDLSLIEQALQAVLDTSADDYLDSDEAFVAIAACEVLAMLRGKPGPSSAYTETAEQWAREHAQAPSASLLKRALVALDRIDADNSELRDLWEESDAKAWREALASLRSRLQ